METETLDTRTTRASSPGRYLPFRTAAVLGAGTMGAQIAAHLANAGLRVELLDVTPSAIGREGAPNSIVERAFKQVQKARPDPFFTKDAARRVRLGNFDDHFDRLGGVDWIIEAVVERMDVKQALHERIEAAAPADAIISTNTSGLSIAEIAEGRSASFRRRFLGTHFFNPPRYQKLLELIPSSETDPEVLARVAHFGRLHLGKGIVVAKDTPYFIGNRVGVYALNQAMRHFTDGDYTIEEVDALTGPLTGRPRSATFRTADLVGLDVMADVARNLYEAVPDDESRDAFALPDVALRLIEQGALGQKTGAGFYRKEGKEIKSINPDTGEYESAADMDLGDVDALWKAGALPERLRAVYAEDGRAGAFFRETTLDLLGYAARRIPEVTDNPADIDRAIRWGFSWDVGPFEIWDALGFEQVLADLRAAGIALPEWVTEMEARGAGSFYREINGLRCVYLPSEGSHVPDEQPSDQLDLARVARKEDAVLWKNDEAALLDLGDGVALYEFRSKANALGQNVMQGLRDAIERVEQNPDLCGLVIGNAGKNFSVGANLMEMATVALAGDFERLEGFLAGFQETIQRVRYARKPVVVAVHQKVLGGACEMAMACPNPVAAAESYLGLVELGVGLIPAGTGATRLAVLAHERAPNGHPSEVQAALSPLFENVAMARVATSARQAQEMGYLAPHGRVVMHEDRRLFVAREEVLRLSNEGYLPPPRPVGILALGRPTRAAFEVMVEQYREGGFISEYDAFLAGQLAYAMTGGALTGPQEVDEDYLLGLEREVFLRLLGEKKTQERIEHLLRHNKPLRN